MEPELPIQYASPAAQPRRPLTSLRILLLVLGLAWFGLVTFGGIGFFLLFRDFGMVDVPGRKKITDFEALLAIARIVGVGLPGLALALAALRFGR